MLHSWTRQDEICLCSGGRRIYEDTHGRVLKQEPWTPHRRERHEFIKSQKSCAQIDSYASSHKNTRSKGSSGEIMDSELVPQLQKIQRSNRTPKWHCERWFRIWAVIISITDDNIKTTGMRRTSSTCSIRFYSGQNGRCINVGKNSKVRKSRYLDTSTETQMAKIMVRRGRPSRSSWAESVRSSSGRTIMGTAIWESSNRPRLGKVFNWECLFVNRARGPFGRYQTGRQDRKQRTDLENSEIRKLKTHCRILKYTEQNHP